MYPKTKEEFDAAMEAVINNARQSRKKKSTWMVEYKGKQHFVTVEKQ